MTRKPTSIADFLKIVAFVEHPSLTQIDRHLLLCIALYADANTGRRAWPGKTNLMKATGMGRTWVKKRLDWLEALGLIQTMAFAKGGRGKATEYRICLENPAFLDYVEGDDEERGHPADPIGNEKGSLNDTKGVTPDLERGHSMVEKGTLQCPPSDSSSEIHPTLHPSEIRKADGMDSSKPSAKDLDAKNEAEEKFFDKHFRSMGDCDKKTRRQIEHLAEQEGQGHPWELMDETMRHFEGRPKGLGGLRDTWKKFLSEASQNISEVKKDSWWQEKCDPEYQARVDAAVERQRKERVAQLEAKLKEPEAPKLAPGEMF